MFGKLNHDQIEEVLKNQFIGRIGCHADGITYVIPVSYVMMENVFMDILMKA
jgi:nitroimidazol reductase NimA-like FMN-containing flavoprotein (pyridoxamine 5'-phosphate oxidase superfamily)